MFKCTKDQKQECKCRIIIESDIMNDWSKKVKYAKGEVLCGRGGGECKISEAKKEVKRHEPIWKSEALENLKNTPVGHYMALAQCNYFKNYHIYSVSIYINLSGERIENICSTGYSAWSNLEEAEEQISVLCDGIKSEYYGILKGYNVPLL